MPVPWRIIREHMFSGKAGSGSDDGLLLGSFWPWVGGGGLQFLTDTLQDAHPIAAHFPIALLVVSAGVSLVVRIKPSQHLQYSSWLLLWVGTIGALQ